MAPGLGAPERTSGTIPRNCKQARSCAQRVQWGGGGGSVPSRGTSDQRTSLEATLGPCSPQAAFPHEDLQIPPLVWSELPACWHRTPRSSCPAIPPSPPSQLCPVSAPRNGPLQAKVSLAGGAEPASPLSPTAGGWLRAESRLGKRGYKNGKDTLPPRRCPQPGGEAAPWANRATACPQTSTQAMEGRDQTHLACPRRGELRQGWSVPPAACGLASPLPHAPAPAPAFNHFLFQPV